MDNALLFFISAEGDDKNCGTETEPFATLERARDEVRKNLEKDHGRDIKVYIRGGVYHINQTIVFDNRDSNLHGRDVSYEAYPGEEPVFSAGVEVTGWRKLEIPVDGLSEEARKKVWIADIPTNLENKKFYTLYENGRRLSRARSRGFLPQYSEEGIKDNYTLKFPKGAVKNWSNLDDVEIVIRPNAPTVLNILGLAKVDEEKCIATTKVAGTYTLLECNHFVDNISESCWVENILEALDSPGQWVLDSKKGKIYLWPENEYPGNITVPGLTELIRIEGDEENNIPIQGLNFKGLGFTQGDRTSLTEDDATAQHEWEFYDKGNALVRLRFAEHCSIEDCRFFHSGGTAVRLDLHCQENKIVNNRIEYIGATGIFLGGYGPGLTNVNKNNKIIGNHIHHVGEIYWHSMGIFVWHSSDNVISSNKIHHTNYSGIVVSGSRPSLFGSCRNTRLFVHHGPREFKASRRNELGPAEKWDAISDAMNHIYPDSTDEFKKVINYIYPFQHTDNNLIENNEIYKVIELLGDGNGIYLSDTGKGNVIRGNYIHDLDGTGGQQAIRTDAFIIGTTICDNIIHRCNGGGINVKHYENHVYNNIIADIRTQISKDRHGKEQRMYFGYISMVSAMLKKFIGPDQVMKIQKNILYKKEAGQSFYRIGNTDGSIIDEHISDSKVKECDLDYNIYYSEANTETDKRIIQTLNEFGLEINGMYADPMFFDLENDDYRLHESSPALKLGFKQLR
ncbi:MAG TPA: peptidase [Prolixibacteraceae bacterium]|nr:peptidase [Prolixibacteraceae bacterium]